MIVGVQQASNANSSLLGGPGGGGKGGIGGDGGARYTTTVVRRDDSTVSELAQLLPRTPTRSVLLLLK